MWNCQQCGVRFCTESIEQHVAANHLLAKLGNPLSVRVFTCGQCSYVGGNFEDIARHCLGKRHDPQSVVKGRDYGPYFLNLFTVLSESVIGGDGEGGGREEETKCINSNNRKSSPTKSISPTTVIAPTDFSNISESPSSNNNHRNSFDDLPANESSTILDGDKDYAERFSHPNDSIIDWTATAAGVNLLTESSMFSIVGDDKNHNAIQGGKQGQGQSSEAATKNDEVKKAEKRTLKQESPDYTDNEVRSPKEDDTGEAAEISAISNSSSSFDQYSEASFRYFSNTSPLSKRRNKRRRQSSQSLSKASSSAGEEKVKREKSPVPEELRQLIGMELETFPSQRGGMTGSLLGHTYHMSKRLSRGTLGWCCSDRKRCKSRLITAAAGHNEGHEGQKGEGGEGSKKSGLKITSARNVHTCGGGDADRVRAKRLMQELVHRAKTEQIDPTSFITEIEANQLIKHLPARDTIRRRLKNAQYKAYFPKKLD